MADFSLGALCVSGNAISLPFPATRQNFEACIEALIAILDVMDGDSDFEDNDSDLGADDFGEEQPPAWTTPRYGIDQCRPPLNLTKVRTIAQRIEDEREIPSFIAEVTGRRPRY